VKPTIVYNNYSDYCEGLNFSDHSPVYGTFAIHVPQYWDIKEILWMEPRYENLTEKQKNEFIAMLEI